MIVNGFAAFYEAMRYFEGTGRHAITGFNMGKTQ